MDEIGNTPLCFLIFFTFLFIPFIKLNHIKIYIKYISRKTTKQYFNDLYYHSSSQIIEIIDKVLQEDIN